MMRTFTSNRNKNQSQFVADTPVFSGFSLLELLVSVALLGLVLSLLYGAFFQISNSSLKVKSTLETRQELRLLMKMILDDLQAVRYLEHFADSGTNPNSVRATGLLAERELGPENPETGTLEEVSNIDFHAAVSSRFFPEAGERDPELHEIGYSLEQNPETKVWQFIRREDFYIDGNLREGGRSHILSEAVTGFDVDFLVRESESGFSVAGNENDGEDWDNVWNFDPNCTTTRGVLCLPRAIKLSMTLRGQPEHPVRDGQTVSDTQVINLCVPPCNPKIFE